MQISSITFQSIRQNCSGRIPQWERWDWNGIFSIFFTFLSFRNNSSSILRSEHFQFILQKSGVPHLSYLPFCRCHNLQHPSGLMASLWTRSWTRTWTWSVCLFVCPCVRSDWLSVGRSVCHSIEWRIEKGVTSSSCACPKDFQSNLSNITTFNQTPKKNTEKKLSSSFFFARFAEDDDETTPQDTHVTTNELTMDNADNPDKQHTNRHRYKHTHTICKEGGRINHAAIYRCYPSIFHIFQFIFAIYSNTSETIYGCNERRKSRIAQRSEQ